MVSLRVNLHLVIVEEDCRNNHEQNEDDREYNWAEVRDFIVDVAIFREALIILIVYNIYLHTYCSFHINFEAQSDKRTPKYLLLNLVMIFPNPFILYERNTK